LRFPVYSLKTGILAQLTFLIVVAMLLINVVVVRFAERDLIRARITGGRMVVYAIEQNLWHLVSQKKMKLKEIDSDPQFRRGVTRLLGEAGFSAALIVDADGALVFSTEPSQGKNPPSVASAREAMSTGLWSNRFGGSTWGVLWLSNKELRVSAPLFSEGRPLGGITVEGSLVPIYETLRKSQKVILLYILLDTMILVMVGIVLLSRIVVKPIHRLLRMTAEYKEGDIVPSLAEASRNEIGELSRSLNIMLRRLDENKRELKAHIQSLEKANKELQQAQGEIIRSEKLASVGRLAAGIAHEIGNPIGIILGYLDLLRTNEITEEERRDFLTRTESEITRINQIIRDLLDFSRPSRGEQVETHVHELVVNTVKMLNPQPVMENIHVAFDLGAADDRVFADPNALQQVFVNVILNAADALAQKDPLESGGAGKELRIRSANVDRSFLLSFSDTGPGIAIEEVPHIFDPFYTTKEPGKGTGLGLSVCYRIVEGLGGKIRAESDAGRGMTIHITVPLIG